MQRGLDISEAMTLGEKNYTGMKQTLVPVNDSPTLPFNIIVYPKTVLRSNVCEDCMVGTYFTYAAQLFKPLFIYLSWFLS